MIEGTENMGAHARLRIIRQIAGAYDPAVMEREEVEWAMENIKKIVDEYESIIGKPGRLSGYNS